MARVPCSFGLVIVLLLALPIPTECETSGKIVNGLRTTGLPSVVSLFDPSSGGSFCTGTLIGCETVLTAAHCVCSQPATGATCQPGGVDLKDPSEILIYTQHAGIYPVLSIAVPPEYVFGVEGDVAVLKLGAPTTGIAPSRINTFGKPLPFTLGEITGFGLTFNPGTDFGVKRTGLVLSETCTTVPDVSHVCWYFEDPLGLPGFDSNTCPGDSGGPLFMDFGKGPLVAGVTSGGLSSDCQPFDASYDSDVFYNLAFIQAQGGADINESFCAPLPQAGIEAPILGVEGILDLLNNDDIWIFPVAAGTDFLVFGLNAEMSGSLDLYVRLGSPPTTSVFDCASAFEGTSETCIIAAPAPGDWYVLVNRSSGSALYQLVTTSYDVDIFVFADGFESGDISAWN